MTNKQRAYLSSMASNINPILQLGKASLTPEFVEAVDEALAKRELIKISVLKGDEIIDLSNRGYSWRH